MASLGAFDYAVRCSAKHFAQMKSETTILGQKAYLKPHFTS